MAVVIDRHVQHLWLQLNTLTLYVRCVCGGGGTIPFSPLPHWPTSHPTSLPPPPPPPCHPCSSVRAYPFKTQMEKKNVHASAIQLFFIHRLHCVGSCILPLRVELICFFLWKSMQQHMRSIVWSLCENVCEANWQKKIWFMQLHYTTFWIERSALLHLLFCMCSIFSNVGDSESAQCRGVGGGSS